MRTGMNQGPRQMRIVENSDREPLNFDFSLEEAIKKSLGEANWLEEADLGAAMTAILLSQTMDADPDRRHQIAPILIGLLSNLGLLNNRKTDKEMSAVDMLTAIANGN
jgi:hypothetical protein